MSQTYIFFREESWYPIIFEDDGEAIQNALCNTGTIRIEDILGKIIWEKNNIKH